METNSQYHIVTSFTQTFVTSQLEGRHCWHDQWPHQPTVSKFQRHTLSWAERYETSQRNYLCRFPVRPIKGPRRWACRCPSVSTAVISTIVEDHTKLTLQKQISRKAILIVATTDLTNEHAEMSDSSAKAVDTKGESANDKPTDNQPKISGTHTSLSKY